jgi:hypothetical protein
MAALSPGFGHVCSGIGYDGYGIVAALADGIGVGFEDSIELQPGIHNQNKVFFGVFEDCSTGIGAGMTAVVAVVVASGGRSK